MAGGVRYSWEEAMLRPCRACWPPMLISSRLVMSTSGPSANVASIGVSSGTLRVKNKAELLVVALPTLAEAGKITVFAANQLPSADPKGGPQSEEDPQGGGFGQTQARQSAEDRGLTRAPRERRTRPPTQVASPTLD